MGLTRSTFYDTPLVPVRGDELLAHIGAICDEFECYGYRRVGAALRHQGVVVNGKKLRRLMREHGLQPKPRRRYVVTTASNHAGPIYPDLSKNLVPDRPNPLWVADLTYVAILGERCADYRDAEGKPESMLSAPSVVMTDGIRSQACSAPRITKAMATNTTKQV
jgi:hypothetical protein